MTRVQLKCFLALTKHLNFSKAAKELCISQSTLSMHIAALEKNLDLTLFIRNNRSVELSPEGEIIFSVFQDIDERLDKALSEAHNLHKSHANILRIGLAQGQAANAFLTDIFDEFRKENEHITLEVSRLSNRDLTKSLSKYSIDIGITLEAILNTSPNLDKAIVYETAVSIMYAHKLLPRRKEVHKLEDLCNETFIVLSKDEDPTEYEYLLKLCDKYQFRPKEIIEVPSIETQILNVEFGMGVCLSNHMSRVYGNPIFGFLDIPDMSVKCYAVSRKCNPNPLAGQFLSFLRKDGSDGLQVK